MTSTQQVLPSRGSKLAKEAEHMNLQKKGEMKEQAGCGETRV